MRWLRARRERRRAEEMAEWQRWAARLQAAETVEEIDAIWQERHPKPSHADMDMAIYGRLT